MAPYPHPFPVLYLIPGRWWLLTAPLPRARMVTATHCRELPG